MLARSEFSQVRKSQHDFALLSVVCNALIVSRGFQHTSRAIWPRSCAAIVRHSRARVRQRTPPKSAVKVARRSFVPRGGSVAPTNLSHNIVEEQSSNKRRCRVRGIEEAMLLESEKYRQYAADCIRMARTMNAGDKQTLLEIAAAWDERAREAERREAKSGRT